MAQRHGFFQYLRLKVIVVLLRTYLRLTSGDKIRRDQALVPRDVKHERVKIPSREASRYILADIYYPPGFPSSSSASPQTLPPVLVNWHGSGFVFPLLGTDALFSSRMARETGTVVVDADYRKAPETPFPGPLHDAEDALRWVGTQSYRFDTTRVAVCGFSAGANLALTTATSLRKNLRGLVDIRVALINYGLLDLAADPVSKKVPRPINAHPIWALHMFNDCYAPDVESRTDPAVSPSFAHPEDFPPTVALLSAEGDTLWPEANTLAKNLEVSSAPVKVVNKIFEGVPHAFDKGTEEGTVAWKRREEAYALMASLLKESFGL